MKKWVFRRPTSYVIKRRKRFKVTSKAIVVARGTPILAGGIFNSGIIEKASRRSEEDSRSSGIGIIQ